MSAVSDRILLSWISCDIVIISNSSSMHIATARWCRRRRRTCVLKLVTTWRRRRPWQSVTSLPKRRRHTSCVARHRPHPCRCQLATCLPPHKQHST